MQFKFIFLNVFIIYLFLLNFYLLSVLQSNLDRFDWIEFVDIIHTSIRFVKNNYNFLENNKHNMSFKIYWLILHVINFKPVIVY